MHVSFISQVEKAAERADGIWRRNCRRLDDFPSITKDVFGAASLHKQFRESELVSWISKTKVFPKQFDPNNHFGDPCITLWSNRHFIVDVCLWGISNTNLHSHGFAGAVINLQGTSLQAEYIFTIKDRHSKNVDLGELRVQDARVLQVGQIQQIEPSNSFVHMVWHLDVPTITLNIRSRTELVSHDHYHPGTRIRVSSTQASIETQRHREMIGYVIARQHPDRERIIESIVCAALPHEGLYLLQMLNPGMYIEGGNSFFDRLVDKARKIHGRWIGETIAARNPVSLLRTTVLDRLGSMEQRLLVALLCTFDNRDDILEWIRKELKPPDMSTAIANWIAGMIRERAIRTKARSIDERILKVLLTEESDENICESLRRYDDVTISDAEVLRELLQDVRTNDLLAPLFSRPTSRISAKT